MFSPSPRQGARASRSLAPACPAGPSGAPASTPFRSVGDV